MIFMGLNLLIVCFGYIRLAEGIRIFQATILLKFVKRNVLRRIFYVRENREEAQLNWPNVKLKS